jgi:hypothetical protein
MAIRPIKNNDFGTEEVPDEIEEVPVKSKIKVDGLPDVKQIVRYISKGMPQPQANFYSVEEVDAYVDSWLKQGYSLFNTHYIGEVPEAFGVLYILVR